MFENVFQNLLVVFILAALFLLVYCKWTGKTIGDLIRDIREATEPEEYMVLE